MEIKALEIMEMQVMESIDQVRFAQIPPWRVPLAMIITLVIALTALAM